MPQRRARRHCRGLGHALDNWAVHWLNLSVKFSFCAHDFRYVKRRAGGSLIVTGFSYAAESAEIHSRPIYF